MPTIAQVEAEIVGRTKDWLLRVQKSIVTDGTNPDLVSPISRAIRIVGGTVATLGSLSQADIDSVDPKFIDALLDYAEYFTLEMVSGLIIEGHIKELDYEEWGDTGKNLATRLARLWAWLGERYPFDAANSVSAGTLDLSISQTWTEC